VTLFRVWITLLTVAYESSLIAALVKRGLTVGPMAGAAGQTSWTCDASTLVAYDVGTNLNHNELARLLVEVSMELGVRYHSMIVVHSTGSSFMGGNIKFPEKTEPEKTRFDKVREGA
jgi:hypothetical protein